MVDVHYQIPMFVDTVLRMLRVEENLRPTFFAILYTDIGLKDNSMNSIRRTMDLGSDFRNPQFDRQRRRSLDSLQETKPLLHIFNDDSLTFRSKSKLNPYRKIEPLPSMDTLTTLIDS